MNSRSQNAKRNTIWGFVNRFLNLLLPFATRTVIIRVLGSEYLGLTSLFTSVLTVLNLAELGIGSAIVYSMYKPLAQGDDELVCALLKLYKKIYQVIGGVVIVVGGCIAPFITFLIKGDIPDGINVYILYLMYILNTAVSYILFAYKTSLLNATQRSDIVSKTNSFFNVFVNVARIGVVILFKNYYLFVTVQILATIFVNIVNAACAKKLYPQYVCKGIVPEEVKKDIKDKVAGLLMIKVSAVSRNALDSIIISSFFGLTAVAAYDNYYYVINAITSLLLVIMNAIAAGVGNSIAVETKDKNYQTMRIINFLYLSISGICAACLISLFQDFITLWVGKELLFPNSMMYLFVFYFVLLKVGDVQAQYFDGAGLWWHGRMRGFIEAGANLVLNILLGFLLGPLGVLLATIITIILINFPLSTYFTFKYYYEISPKTFIFEQSKNVLIICISCIPSAIMSAIWHLSINNGIAIFILQLGLKLIIGTLTFLGIYYIAYRDSTLANKAIQWMKQVIKA